MEKELPIYYKVGADDAVRVNTEPEDAFSVASQLAEVVKQEKYDVIEFELDEPKIVLDRSKLPQANMIIAQTYGIDKSANIK